MSGIEINTAHQGYCLTEPCTFASRHFQIAFAKQEAIQELWQNQVINTHQEDLPSLQIQLGDRIKHFIIGLLELIPVIGYIIVFVERYFILPRSDQSQQMPPLGLPLQTGSSVNTPSSIEAQNIRTNCPKHVLFGSVDEQDANLTALVAKLIELPPMNKQAMSGGCYSQTTRMEQFLKNTLGMQNLDNEYFVQGVKAFCLNTPLESLPEGAILEFKDERGTSFRMSKEEVIRWQQSFTVYADMEHYQGHEEMGNENLDVDLIQKSLQGQSADGEEAWKMKFTIRLSENPILTEFDGRVIARQENTDIGKVYLVSVCGVDFAGRKHDILDIQMYVQNWNQVYQLQANGSPIVCNGRDFVPTGTPAVLNEELLCQDLKRMIKLRLFAQDRTRIETVVETAIGLGVFAGDRIGIGNQVRRVYVRAFREVLEESAFENIKLVCLAMPIFRPVDNYGFFEEGLEGYTGKTAVLLLDQDMHKIANKSAQSGFITSELNPADSHGVVGEYWQNRRPGTEEKLAMTTLALLTQHHAINPYVLDTTHYHPLSLLPS